MYPRRNQNAKTEEQVIARARTGLSIQNTRRTSESRSVITPGVYNLPFEFLLPMSLPSSTQFPNVNSKTFSGRIQYFLTATVADLQTRLVVRIMSAPLPPSVIPCISHPTTHELKQAKLLKKGSLTVATCVENTHVGRGEHIKVSVACRNSSTVDIERVQIKLIELIEYKAQDENRSLKLHLRSMKDIHLRGLDKSRSKDFIHSSTRINGRNSSIAVDMSSIHRHLLRGLMSGENQFSVLVPSTARDTYDGCLLKISHYLKITFITRTLVDNPSFKLPVVIGTPNPDADHQQRHRAPNEPIATVVIGDSPALLTPTRIPEPSDESTVEVGSDIPMTDAIILDTESEPEQNPPDNNIPLNVSMDTNQDVVIDASNVFPCDTTDCVEPSPVPSAPDESILIHGYQTTANSHTSAYAPFDMYNNNTQHRNIDFMVQDGSFAAVSSNADESIRPCIDRYSYSDSVNNVSDQAGHPQLGHGQHSFPVQCSHSAADRTRMLEQVLRDVRSSFHDYEVIAGKLRIPQYRQFFSTLTPKEFGRIVKNTSMAHQVEISTLLARELVYSSNFTCAHCAEVINHANNYLRTNMVETLTPMVCDFTENQDLIHEQLSAWELALTEDVFEGLS
jgi:hypothetical protein